MDQEREYEPIGDFDDPKKWLTSEILNLCGCGRPEEIAAVAFRVFEAFATGKFLDSDELIDEIIAKLLDNAGLITHGSSIFGAFLTPLGETVYRTICDRIEAIRKDRAE